MPTRCWNLVAAAAGHREPRDIAFDIGHEDRHTKSREAFRHHHQRHRLAGAGGAGHQPVPIAVLRVQVNGLFALAQEDPIHVRRVAYDKRGTILSAEIRLELRPLDAIRRTDFLGLQLAGLD